MKKKHVLFCFFAILLVLFPIFILGNVSKHQQDLYDNKQLGILENVLSKTTIPQVEWSNLSCQEKVSFFERLIMLSYVPLINEAVEIYYKEQRGFDLVEITDVKAAGPYEYEMKIKLSTYVGAHNPPYGIDTVTIHFNKLNDGKVVNFEHKNE